MPPFTPTIFFFGVQPKERCAEGVPSELSSFQLVCWASSFGSSNSVLLMPLVGAMYVLPQGLLNPHPIKLPMLVYYCKRKLEQ